MQSKGLESLQEILKTESLKNIHNSFSSDKIIQTIAKWRASGFLGEVSREYESNPGVLDDNDLKGIFKINNFLIESISG